MRAGVILILILAFCAPLGVESAERPRSGDAVFVQGCRAAAVRSGFASSAAAPATVHEEADGTRWVFLSTVIACTFEAGAPPQLREVSIAGCYECFIMLDPATIEDLNILLADHFGERRADR